MLKEPIRDRILVGIKNRKLSEQLQLDSDLTLSKAIQRVRQSETVKKQQTLPHSNSVRGVTTTNVDPIKAKWNKIPTKCTHDIQRAKQDVKI